MPPKPPIKKARQTRNTSGLRNQKRDHSVVFGSSGHPTPARSLAPSPGGDESDPEDDHHFGLILSFTKYWGWCKYRYWEHPKANFADAKE